MITLAGQLAIRTIHGKNGDFNVGRLSTNIGEFYVKDADLEQYPEGKYDGDFIITEIFQYSYSSGNRSVTETRARLGGMTLSGTDALSNDEAREMAPQEVDPIDEAPSRVVIPQTSDDPLANDQQYGYSNEDAIASENDDAALFGVLYPIGQTVKLDSTVDRKLLRRQKERLEQLGYRFDFNNQIWNSGINQNA